MKPLLIKASDVWVDYEPGKHVLAGVNIEIHAGMTTMILGRSGSGKTTLLRALGGMIRPRQGRVEHINGRHRIAYIPQSLGLVRGLSVLENTLMGVLRDTPIIPSLFKQFSRAHIGKAMAILAAVGLKDRANERVLKLSGGQRQRVAIARALIQEPDIILADEFVAHLDVWTTHEIFDLLKPLSLKKVAMMITTHDADLVKQYAHQVVVMSQGKIIFESQASDVSTVEMVDHLR